MPRQPSPTISRVLADGTLIDLVFDADAGSTAFAVCPPSGVASLAEQFAMVGGELLVPYAATNNLLTSGCVLLPSGLAEMGAKAELLAGLKGFIHRYVGFSPVFEDVAAHYILLSWVYDAFNEVPYLRLAGEYGSGKTRGLLGRGRLAPLEPAEEDALIARMTGEKDGGAG